MVVYSPGAICRVVHALVGDGCDAAVGALNRLRCSAEPYGHPDLSRSAGPIVLLAYGLRSLLTRVCE
jgi:hypothetical protein